MYEPWNRFKWPNKFFFTLHSDENTFPMFNAYFGDRIEFLHRSFFPVCSEVSMTLKSIVKDRKSANLSDYADWESKRKQNLVAFYLPYPFLLEWIIAKNITQA